MNHCRKNEGVTFLEMRGVRLSFAIFVAVCAPMLLLGTGSEAQEPKLQFDRTVLESPSVPGSYFGESIAASGDTVVVSSYTSGAVVYVKPPGGWTNATPPTAILTASDTTDGMGAVAIDGDVIVAAPMYTNEAYVFVKPATGWVRYVNAAGAERVASMVGTDEADRNRNHISWVSPPGGGALMKSEAGDSVCPTIAGRSQNLMVLEVRYQRLGLKSTRRAPLTFGRVCRSP